jgi:hypothetical protein
LGDITRRRSPLRLGPAGYDRQAQFKFTRRRSTICHYGRPRPPSFGLSGPFVSSHRTRVRKASQRFVSLKAFNTEETNQRFRQRSAKVPSSNQWIITQPTPCLLRLRASKGVLSRENVNSSAVSGNTMRGAARISGARARVSCRPRLRAHPRLRYRRSQPCAMRSPFPANAWQRAVLIRSRETAGLGRHQPPTGVIDMAKVDELLALEDDVAIGVVIERPRAVARAKRPVAALVLRYRDVVRMARLLATVSSI